MFFKRKEKPAPTVAPVPVKKIEDDGEIVAAIMAAVYMALAAETVSGPVAPFYLRRITRK